MKQNNQWNSKDRKKVTLWQLAPVYIPTPSVEISVDTLLFFNMLKKRKVFNEWKNISFWC